MLALPVDPARRWVTAPDLRLQDGLAPSHRRTGSPSRRLCLTGVWDLGEPELGRGLGRVPPHVSLPTIPGPGDGQMWS